MEQCMESFDENIGPGIQSPKPRAKRYAVYYVQADGKEDLLIYGEDLYSGGGVKTLPRLFLTYYAFIASKILP